MSYYPYRFEAPVVTHDVGSQRYLYTVVFLPAELAGALPLKEYPRLRISGEAAEQPFEAALTPVRGRWYILLSKKMLKAMEAGLGDVVEVCFRIADQNAVEMPSALERALAADRALARLWDRLTPGRQRGLAYRVAAAKTETTRAKRIAEVAAILRGERDERGRPLK